MQTSHNFSVDFKNVATVCFLTALLTTFRIETNAEVLPIRTYTAADGLGSSAISYLMRDSRGFLWFCTRDGLTRFDGQRFTTYQVGAKGAAPAIERIHETRNGIYWITTTSGLYRFDPKASFSPSLPENVLNAEYIGSSRGIIREGNDGRLWYLASGLFLITAKEGKLEFQEVELSLPAKPEVSLGVREMLEAGDGSRWVLTTLGLVRLLPDGDKIIYQLAPPNKDAIFSMVIDGEGRIWISRSSGIYVLNPESIQTLNQPGNRTRDIDKARLIRSDKPSELQAHPGEIVKLVDLPGIKTTRPKFLYRSADDHIWISTSVSLIEFDGLRFQTYTAAHGLTSGVGQMVEDLNGNLWIGGTEGVARLNRRGLTTYGADDGLKTLSISVIDETSDGNLFAASPDFFVSQFDGKKFHTVRPPVLSSAYALWSSNPVFLDSHNQWWFLTQAKLLRFGASNVQSLANARPIAEYDMRNGLKGNEMFHMFEDSRGDLWLATRAVDADNFGLSKWTRAKDSFHTFSDRENFPKRKSVSAFAEDTEGQLWIGFYEGGLMRYSGGRFTEITASEAFLSEELISDLHIDRNGKLWVSSSKAGVARIDDLNTERPTLVRYNVDNGLSSNNVRSLVEDNYGQIYAGTARGVNRITPETGRIRHYSTVDGLAADFVQSAFKDHNGVLWFGSPNGISKLIPTADVTADPPQVWLSSLRIAGENRTVAKLGSAEINAEELAPGQNNLQITFFGIDFNTGEPLRYQYMLEGADRDWNPPTSERTVNFSNLSAGNYRFLVRAVSASGLVSKTPAVFSFKLLPPIWARWWFIGGAISLALVAFFSVYRYRLAQLKKVNVALDQLQKSKEERLLELERVRSRIARDLHDDIGSSLAQIAIYSEVAKQKQQGNNGADPTLQSLVNTSKELVDAMSDIVWAINPRKDHLHDLTQRMRHFASEVLSAAEIDLEFQAPESPPDLSLGANIRREVFLIFKENINNIARHSGATRVEIEFLLKQDHLTLRFHDNGRGFDYDSQSQAYDWQKARGGNGLISMKKRSHELGGEYLIESQPGVGTTAVLRVPLDGDLSNEAPVATQTGNDRSRLNE